MMFYHAHTAASQAARLEDPSIPAVTLRALFHEARQALRQARAKSVDAVGTAGLPVEDSARCA